jgi:hypothetical protein
MTLETAWKRLVVRAAVGGAAFGVVVLTVFGFGWWYTQRPKQWDRMALRTVHVEAQPLDHVDEHNGVLEVKSTGTIVYADVLNATKEDITLPETLKVMQRKRASAALHESLLKLDRNYFIPAGHVVSILLSNSGLCSAEMDPTECYDSYLKDDSELVIFEPTRKYEIRIQIPSLTKRSPLYSPK